MKRFLGGLVGVLLVAVFILSRTEWGRQQIGGSVMDLFSGHRASAEAGAPAEPAAQPGAAAGTAAPAADPNQGKPRREIPPLPTRRPQTPPRAPSAGGGSFQVLVELNRKTGTSPAGQLVYKSRVLYEHTDYLNSIFDLPKNIMIDVKRCGFSNMYWDPQKERITICDEMIEELGGVFKDEPDDAVFRRRVMFATSYFMFHEVGHALVQEYGLKGFGKQEDIADQIAFLLLLGNDEAETVASGADAFMGFANAQPNDAPRAFWDEHALNEQRYYNLVCWIYGSNPKQFAGLVSDNVLPAERAARCPGEVIDIIQAFNQQFGPHLKR